MEAFVDKLSGFKTITLDEINSVKLMDRTDTKFVFSVALLPELLEKLSAGYTVLQINNSFISSYKTLYFDTPGLKLYTDHHNGKLNRYKVRYRNYNAGNSGFLEVKFKTNTGKTLKKRIVHHGLPEHWNEAALNFIKTHTPYDPLTFEPIAHVNYQRIAFADKLLKERVTIDLNLEFLSGPLSHKLENLAICEIKCSSNNKSPATALMKELKIKKMPLSKYCLAVTKIYPHVKKNNFKAILATLNKLSYDTSFSAAANI